MELKTFITDTLTQIIDGTKDAVNKTGGKGDDGLGCINPEGDKDLYSCVVSFDVALTVEETQSNISGNASETGGRIQIAQVLSLGHKRGKSAANQAYDKSQSASRIQFAIPIRLPATQDAKKFALEDKERAMHAEMSRKMAGHMAR